MAIASGMPDLVFKSARARNRDKNLTRGSPGAFKSEIASMMSFGVTRRSLTAALRAAVQLDLFNAVGECVLMYRGDRIGHHIIDVQHLASGMYVLVVRSGTQFVSKMVGMVR